MGQLLKDYAKEHGITITKELRKTYQDSYLHKRVPFEAPLTDKAAEELAPYRENLNITNQEITILQSKFITYQKAGDIEQANIYFDELDKKMDENLRLTKQMSTIKLENERKYCAKVYNTEEKILNESCKILLCIPKKEITAEIKRFRNIMTEHRVGTDLAKQTNTDLCKRFLEIRLRMMFNAIYWLEPKGDIRKKEITKIVSSFVNDRVNDFYPGPKAAVKVEVVELTPPGIVHMPAGPIQRKAMQTFAYLNDLDKLEQLNSSKEQIAIKKAGDSLAVKYNTENAETSIMTDIKLLKDKNLRTLAKPFNFIMVTALRQPKGKRLEFEFTLQDLVDYNLYSSKVSARNQIETLCTKLVTLNVSCSSKKYKTGTEQGFKGFLPLFKALYLADDRNTVIVKINDEIDEEFLFNYLAPLPHYAFILKTDSFYLLNYISVRARQNLENIKENGKFNINMQKVCEYMGLDIKTPKFKEKIKDVINRAVDEIKEQDQGTNYKITLHYNDRATKQEYLDNGYIEVIVKGDMLKTLQDLKDRNEKETQKTIKRIQQKKKAKTK